MCCIDAVGGFAGKNEHRGLNKTLCFFGDNKNSLLGATRRLKPAVLHSSLNREFLGLKIST